MQKHLTNTLILALLTFGIYSPTNAAPGEISQNKLTVGELVEVVFRDHNGKQTTSKGHIKAIGNDSLRIGSGFWKESIAFKNIINLKKPTIRKKQGMRVDIGQRVRINTPNHVTGTLVSMTNDTLTLKSDNGSTLTLHRSSITNFEIFQKKTNMRAGAGLGFMAGLVFSVALLSSLDSDQPKRFDNPTSREGLGLDGSNVRPLELEELNKKMLISTLAMTSGTVVGALIGKSVRTAKWRQIPLDQIHVGFQLKNHRHLAMSLSMSF